MEISRSPTLPLSHSVVTDAAAWDAALLSLPSPHILQSWAWGELKAQTGWRAQRLIWCDSAPRAAASLLIRRLNRRVPVAVAYVPKGPLLDWSNASLVDEVLGQIEAEARRAGALFVKIDPDVRADVDPGQAVMAALRRRGWRPSAEQIQYRNTVISDLTPDEDALLAAMKPKWRYNIRLAERRGVVVRDGTAADLPAFYAMYAETGGRDGFLVRPFDYYRAIWARFLADGLGHVLLAEVEGAPVAGLFIVPLRPDRVVFLRRIHGAEPRSDAEPRAPVGGDALGEGGRLHALRLVGRAGRARRERSDVGRLSLQAGIRRRVHALDRRVGFSGQPGGVLGVHGRDAEGAGSDAAKTWRRLRSFGGGVGGCVCVVVFCLCFFFFGVLGVVVLGGRCGCCVVGLCGGSLCSAKRIYKDFGHLINRVR